MSITMNLISNYNTMYTSEGTRLEKGKEQNGMITKVKE